MSSFSQVKIAPSISIRAFEDSAFERYQECPRFMTIIAHADNRDDSLLHCFLSKEFIGPTKPGMTNRYRRDFIVPVQDTIVLQDERYGLFSMLKVIDPETEEMMYLFSSVVSRMGFTTAKENVPLHILSTQEVEEMVA